MTYLLDVNLLIALLDPHHLHHGVAHRWMRAASGSFGWATCPLTQIAFVRIVGRSSYPNSPGSAGAALDLLRENCQSQNHHFWADEVDLVASGWPENKGLLSPSHLTDLYLLALAARRRGKLASLDQRIPAHLVPGGADALVLLPV